MFKDEILGPYLRELLPEQYKYICLNQNKTLSNLQQRIAFEYGPLTKICTGFYFADKGESNPLLEISKLFH